MSPRRLTLIAALWLLPVALCADPLVSLAVVPFVNLSHYQGHLLERRAAAAIAAEAQAPWAPVDPVLVQRTLADMAAPSPLGTAEMQALCSRLPAALGLQGALSAAQVDAGSARVTLNVELLEPLSGEVVGKAQAEGRAQSRDPLPRDQLLDQALQQAARSAMKALGTPWVVGQVAPPAPGEPLMVTLGKGVYVKIGEVLLLIPASPEQPARPVAAAVVVLVDDANVGLKLLGKRTAPAGGEIAVCVGRLP